MNWPKSLKSPICFCGTPKINRSLNARRSIRQKDIPITGENCMCRMTVRSSHCKSGCRISLIQVTAAKKCSGSLINCPEHFLYHCTVSLTHSHLIDADHVFLIQFPDACQPACSASGAFFCHHLKVCRIHAQFL